MPDPLYRQSDWGRGAGNTPLVNRIRPDITTGQFPFEKKSDHRSVTAQHLQQKRIASRVSKKGFWEGFKKFMKTEYGADDKWLDNKAGSVKAMINELSGIKSFVDRVRSAGDEDINVDNMLREIHGSIIKALSEVSKKNELHLNEGSFRNYIAHEIPNLDPRRGGVESLEGPPDMNDDIIRDTDRLMSWIQ